MPSWNPPSSSSSRRSGSQLRPAPEIVGPGTPTAAAGTAVASDRGTTVDPIPDPGRPPREAHAEHVASAHAPGGDLVTAARQRVAAIAEEMGALGGQEIYVPVVTPSAIWRRSRLDP